MALGIGGVSEENQVPTQVNRLKALIENLHKSIAELSVKTTSLRVNRPEAPTKQEEKEGGPLAPLASELSLVAKEIERAISIVDNLRNDIEL